MALYALEVNPLRVSARAWPGGLRGLENPGLYSWWVDEAGAQNLSSSIALPVVAGRIYAGQTGATAWPSGRLRATTLRGRIGENHLRGNIGGSTFRWTLAAALRVPLSLDIVGRRQLDRDSEQRLSAWMREHPEVAVHAFPERDPLAHLEDCVLARLDPPLNLDGMPETPLLQRLSRLRKALNIAAAQRLR